MKTLLILRHAKSSWSHAGISDHDRPLNQRGKEDAPRMGELLRKENLIPDLIVSSTAKRARDTANRVAKACGYEGEILLDKEFYHASPESYIEGLWANGGAAEIVMVVGHNPGMEELIYELTSESVHMTTANIAHIEFAIEAWAEVGKRKLGKLRNVWRPKEV